MSDPNQWRPEGHPPGKPWPPKVREYPPDHPARRDEESKQAFNWEWAVEDFGEPFVHEIAGDQSKFTGDWWLLALLKSAEQAARMRDPDGTDFDRMGLWNTIRMILMQQQVVVHLEYANLGFARLQYTKLHHARMENANFLGASLACADLFGARLEHSSLHQSDLTGSVLNWARLQEANLLGARLERAWTREANLTGADVRKAIGLHFDTNHTRNINIEGDAPDPWSILRRSYTGPWFFVHLGLLLAFILPYVGKVLALTAADYAGRVLESAAAYAPGIQSSVRVEHIPAWRVLVGLDRGWWVPLLGGVLLLYNLTRGVLTIKVGQLRDAEERSGISPRLVDYMGTQSLNNERWPIFLWPLAREALWWGVGLSSRDEGYIRTPRLGLAAVGLWRLHRFLRLLLYIALASFAVHAIYWLRTTTVPVITTSPSVRTAP